MKKGVVAPFYFGLIKKHSLITKEVVLQITNNLDKILRNDKNQTFTCDIYECK